MPRHFTITGNIGSGKTTVCREFERLGVPVYYADVRGKELMAEDAKLRAAIIDAFGSESYQPDGGLDRAYLAKRVFGDPAALDHLNSLVHPAVARDAAAWQERQTRPYTLHEAAIILEIDGANRFDGVIVVTCPYPIRLARVLQRDSISKEDFDRRAARQWSDERKEAAADYVIKNEGRHLLLPQILKLHRQFSSPFHGQ